MTYTKGNHVALTSTQYKNMSSYVDELDDAVTGLNHDSRAILSADERNAVLATKGYSNPYKAGTPVYQIKTAGASSTQYVRVYTNNQTNRVGSWFMKYSDIKGLTATQIQEKFALPNTPTHYCFVNVPNNAQICVGYVGPQNFSSTGGGIYYGGGIQYEFMTIIDKNCFGSGIALH